MNQVISGLSIHVHVPDFSAAAFRLAAERGSERRHERLLAIAAPSPDGKDAGLEDAVRLSLGYIIRF